MKLRLSQYLTEIYFQMFLLTFRCYCESSFKLVIHFNQKFFTFHGARNFSTVFYKTALLQATYDP